MANYHKYHRHVASSSLKICTLNKALHSPQNSVDINKYSVQLCIYPNQGRSQDLTFGGHRSRAPKHRRRRGTLFFAKSRCLRNLSISEAHRTLPVERTVLLYCIKQALHVTTKPAFFPKKSTQSTIGGHVPSLATPMIQTRSYFMKSTWHSQRPSRGADWVELSKV